MTFSDAKFIAQGLIGGLVTITAMLVVIGLIYALTYGVPVLIIGGALKWLGIL